MTDITSPLWGSYLEMYATVGDDRRYIPKTTDDVYIDAQTGAVDFKIIIEGSFEGLAGAFIVNDNGDLTGIEEYDTFEIEFYPWLDPDGEPHARYYAVDPEVEADLEFPIVEDMPLAHVTVTPRGRCGFEQLTED